MQNDRKLADWLEKRYSEWKATQDRKHDSLSAFAIFLGIKEQLLNALVNNRRTSVSQETADKIADKLGDDIYDLVDLPRPDPLKRRVAAILDSLNDDGKQKLANYAEKLFRQNQRGVGRADAGAETKAAPVR